VIQKKKPHLSVQAGRATFLKARVVAQDTGQNLHAVALRFALERFLARVFGSALGDGLYLDPSAMDVSIEGNTVTLKGGMVMCFAEDRNPLQGRSTSDADLHVTGFAGSMQDFVDILKGVLAGPPPQGPDDGVRFDTDEMMVARVKEENSGGTVTIPLQIAEMTLQVKSDCTFDLRPMHADAPVVEYPSVLPALGLPAFKVRRVPFEFMVADKVAAMISLGDTNYRIRDYHDVYVILSRDKVDREALVRTFAATCAFKRVALPQSVDAVPGLSDAFAAAKSDRWLQERVTKRFSIEAGFPEVVRYLRDQLRPVFAAAHGLDEMPAWAAAPRGRR